MSTPLDRALASKPLFLTFAALITAATAWSVWGQDMFPTPPQQEQQSEQQQKPENWSEAELRNWLEKENVLPLPTESREDLLVRVRKVLSNAF